MPSSASTAMNATASVLRCQDLSWPASASLRLWASQTGLHMSCAPRAISARARVTSCLLPQTGQLWTNAVKTAVRSSARRCARCWFSSSPVPAQEEAQHDDRRRDHVDENLAELVLHARNSRERRFRSEERKMPRKEL